VEEGGEAGLGAKIGRRNRLPKGPQFQDDERTIRAGDQNRFGRASESVSRLFLRRACGRVRACACVCVPAASTAAVVAVSKESPAWRCFCFAGAG